MQYNLSKSEMDFMRPFLEHQKLKKQGHISHEELEKKADEIFGDVYPQIMANLDNLIDDFAEKLRSLPA